MRRQRLTTAEARRIAIGEQGLDKSKNPSLVDVRHIRRTIMSLGLLQLDFVKVLIPAHLLVVYSRLGAYELGGFQRAVYARGEFTEQWAHEASIVPMNAWPLLAYRRRAYRERPRSSLAKTKDGARYLQEVLDIVREKGALTSQDLAPVSGPKRKPGDWHRSVPHSALDHHFGSGRLAVKNRLANFQRVYDLPERLIGESQRSQQLSDDDARRELLKRAATACGVATLRDLADYYRMTLGQARPRVLELVEEGLLDEVAVDGWDEPAYLARDARVPRSVRRATLLSPLDPLVWYRPRTERLFDFHYRIEIYVPEHKRRWGYYVLPFLLHDQLAARVDLKADRQTGTLMVRAAYLEPGSATLETPEALANKLFELAAWLGLERVSVGRRGDMARALSRAVAARVRGYSNG
ncbi:MAG: winged helix-turn-helix domain-containing protein [Candidatus Rariloculaceae bacterium]